MFMCIPFHPRPYIKGGVHTESGVHHARPIFQGVQLPMILGRLNQVSIALVLSVAPVSIPL